MANYLHGVETIELKDGLRSISVVKSAVIGLVGIAPKGASNTPIVVNSDVQAAQFGKKVPGFSIPQSLDAIFKQGAGTVIVVNVFELATHGKEETAEAHTLVSGKTKLAYPPLNTVAVLDSAGAATAYVEGTDYAIDEYGNFTALNNVISQTESLKFTYKRLDASTVTNAHIIGAVNPSTDARTGMKCFDLAFNLFGFIPKILIAPTFSQISAIAAELIAVADKFRAIAYLDAPAGTTVSQAIAGRSPAGSINFNTSSKRAQLLYPMLKWYDVATDSDGNFPYSAFMAGIRASVDNAEGFWASASNHEIKGITGAERNISAAISDPNSEANQLNENGITTIFNTFGSGIRTWGNRSAAFPTNTQPDNFIAVRRTADVIQESVEQACLQFLDQPITQGWIDSVRESVNSFIRTLVQRGALIDGVCKFITEDNPSTELAAGHVTFYIDFMPPTPAERITFNSFINIDYLTALK